MIDPTKEHCLTLAQAGRRLPGREEGGPVHPSTIKRWIDHGSRGVMLESIQVGGTLMTSEEALARFLAALNPPVPGAKKRRDTDEVTAAKLAGY